MNGLTGKKVWVVMAMLSLVAGQKSAIADEVDLQNNSELQQNDEKSNQQTDDRGDELEARRGRRKPRPKPNPDSSPKPKPDHGHKPKPKPPGSGHPPGGSHPPVNRNGNRTTPSGLKHIHRSAKKMDRMSRNSNLREGVHRRSEFYRKNYRSIVEQNHSYFEKSCSNYRPHFQKYWYPYGFYAYYWQIVPILNLDAYFWNPLVTWFYSQEWDDLLYRTWYGSDFNVYSLISNPFYRVGVFYPTEALVDVLNGVADMPVLLQNGFRRDMIELTQTLEEKLARRTGQRIIFGRNSIVLTHYQILAADPNSEDSAVAFDGFLSFGTTQIPFKALLYLVDSKPNLVFVPSSTEGEPTQEDLNELRELNEQISALGGTTTEN